MSDELVTIRREVVDRVLDVLNARSAISYDDDEYNDDEVIAAEQLLRDELTRSPWIPASKPPAYHLEPVWVFDGTEVLLSLNTEEILGVTHWAPLVEPKPPEPPK